MKVGRGEEVETPTGSGHQHAQTNTTLRYQRDTFCKNTPGSAGTRGFRDEKRHFTGQEMKSREGSMITNKSESGIFGINNRAVNKCMRKWKKHLGYVDTLSFHHTVFFHLNICCRSDSSELCVLARLRGPLYYCIMTGDVYVGNIILVLGVHRHIRWYLPRCVVNKNNVHLLCLISFAPLLLQPSKKKTTNTENKQKESL